MPKVYQCPCCEEELIVKAGSLQFLNPPEGEAEEVEVDNTLYQSAYNNGVPVVPGNRDGDFVVNTPVTQNGSGIRVVTNVSNTKEPSIRQKQLHTAKPAGNMAGVFGPKKKSIDQLTDADHSREGFTSTGDDLTFMRDFDGTTGEDAHMDALLNEAILEDLMERGL